jgi:RIP metalloprotease RseP
MANYGGQEIMLVVTAIDANNTREIWLTPRAEPPDGEGPIGISYRTIGIVTYTGWQKVYSGAVYAINMFSYNVYAIVSLVKTSFAEHTIAPIASGVSGPVGLFYMINITLAAGSIMGLLEILAVIGISLVFVNLLPIPALDGGYIFFLLIEGISGKRLPSKILQYITQVGMIFLILLIVVILFKDLIQFVPGLSEFFCDKLGWFCAAQ